MIPNYTPKYIQIQESLASLVTSGDLRPGDTVPSERELSEQFNVSRMTVRQAISNLVSDGMLHRVQGLGTFVSELKDEYDIGLLVSFTESALQRGLKPSGKVLEFAQVMADERLARLLQINLGHKVYRLGRLRYGNNEPMVLEDCFFPCSRCPEIEKFDLQNQSIYHIWQHEYGIQFGKIRQTLEPVMATELQAELLDVPAGFPMMLVERISFDIHGQPVEYARDIHRGDKSRFVAELDISPHNPAVDVSLS
jgi:GntR family transcriptional regulator